jgi:putative ABC transport system permease protein
MRAGDPTLTDWLQNLRLTLRALARTPGFVILSVLSLGLAIGANVAIFSVVDTVLLDPLPYRDADRLVYVAGTAPGSDLEDEFPLASEFLVQYREQSKLLESVSAYNSFTSTLRVGDRIERVRMSAPSTSVFETLGAQPVLGRLPVPEDEDRVMVISHTLWTAWFGANPNVIGQTHYASGRDRTIIGVMKPGFWFPDDATLLWMPRYVRAEGIQPGRFGQPFVARLAPGATPEALATELQGLARQLPERFGGSATYTRLIEQFRPVLRPFEEELLGAVAGPLWMLLGAMGCVLLVACANVANLFLVRAERRQGELAVRGALGAPRGRLIASQLAEAAVVAALAGCLAVLLAWTGVPLLLAAAPANLPRLGAVAIGPTTLLFTFSLCALSALLCGLAPALRASGPKMATLRAGGRGQTARAHWGRNALVVSQTALALVLLIGSALLLRSVTELRRVDPGYDTADLFTFQIAPESAELKDAPSFARFHLGFLERLAALPGVERVGIVENIPLNEGVASQRFRTPEMPAVEDSGALLSYTWAAGDYFRTLGIDLLRGRTFTDDDQLAGRGHILLSRSAAEQLWPGQDPIGKRLQRNGWTPWFSVIGVVDDVHQYDFRQPPEPMVYFPLVGPDTTSSPAMSSPAYVLKTNRAEEIAPEVRALVREVAPTAPMYRVFTMADLAANSMAQLSFTTLTLGVASLLALVLGLVGLYGVLSYVVAERRREIGLRMALGATSQAVQRMILVQGGRVVALGVVLGIVAALAATRALGTLLFGVGNFNAAAYGTVSVAVLVVGLLACYVPARRASKVAPMVSIRTD